MDTEHAFKVGELVRTKRLNTDRTGGVYEIVRLLPPSPDGIPLYRVKYGGKERVMAQHENREGLSEGHVGHWCPRRVATGTVITVLAALVGDHELAPSPPPQAPVEAWVLDNVAYRVLYRSQNGRLIVGQFVSIRVLDQTTSRFDMKIVAPHGCLGRATGRDVDGCGTEWDVSETPRRHGRAGGAGNAP